MPVGFANETILTNFPSVVSPGVTPQGIYEQTSSEYSVQLNDKWGVGIPNAAFTAITLTLLDEETGSSVNSREAQDVLDFPTNEGQNDVSLSTTGLLTWRIQPEDTVVLTSSKRLEFHKAIFRFVLDLGQGSETIQRVIRIPVLRNPVLVSPPIAPLTDGIVVRLDVDSYVTREIETATAVIEITNGDGIAGNPFVDIPGTGDSNDVLRGDLTWAPVSGAGLGDVTGPGVSVDDNIVVFDGTTGKVIKDSGVSIADIAAGGLDLAPTFLFMGA